MTILDWLLFAVALALFAVREFLAESRSSKQKWPGIFIAQGQVWLAAENDDEAIERLIATTDRARVAR